MPTVPTAVGSAAFLPLTLAAIMDAPAHRSGLRTLAAQARLAERDAGHSWLALLGDCACPVRGRFTDRLRLLSEAAGDYAGGEWWRDRGSLHRDRVTEFERWVGEALAEGNGEEFAEACAGYDAALARALVTVRAAS